MNNYLSAHELAELIGCKPNQRSMMMKWLDSHRWRYVVDSHGLPKVARAYRDKKLGIAHEIEDRKHDETPNLQAFATA
ncbi:MULTISPECIES: DUF4224 domain-containing protein [Pandoraea]|uniref:DUF4224 domain-containing protein n=2 Tax=Pandoraea TaxID=93217 RepID=A0A5E5BUQ3_9BURK|nr:MULTISPECIES: DUF4224 domain-containing protein [Pandoraea]EON12000.1 hypothetical protein C266_17531 [Pandoraea sp. SD6-2]VVE53864.1 hypothetical protein PCO31111_04920 [Pandoraea communis]VVE88030.1 hypothetical protein PBR20603_01974 [Pandoraea bronchicola]